MSGNYCIAQANIARALASMDDAVMADFVNALDPVNRLADEAEGFIWRLQDASGNATSINIFDDPMMIINMSVWEDAESLFSFTYKSDHVDVFRRRGEWFSSLEKPHLVLWWTLRDKMPEPQDCRLRLEHLIDHGPTPYAFTFKQQFTVEEMLAYTSQIAGTD
ncbi:MAG: DUF3291 domain-containing protein [Chloroflexi bacterium]|nr:DUF3291 domain-containing protein [Chloroflexota bacterium]